MQARRITGLTVLTLCCGAVSAVGAADSMDSPEFSGFLSDYSEFAPPPGDNIVDLIWLAPDLRARLAGYDSIMVDQPEIFLHAESPYTGFKPDDMKAIADGFRAAVSAELGTTYAVVEEPGEKVLYLRIAATNLYVKKKRSKNPLNYTPVGFAVKKVRQALTEDLDKKLSLVELSVEVELLDSTTGERLAAAVERLGARKDKEAGQKKDPSSWTELEWAMSEVGRRMRCRLDNARRLEAERVDCL
jgi:hypothetical protein